MLFYLELVVLEYSYVIIIFIDNVLAMSRGTSSSSSSSSKSTEPTTVSDKELLAFYKRKYEEAQTKEDKYKEKVDRHLKNLVADRVSKCKCYLNYL